MPLTSLIANIADKILISLSNFSAFLATTELDVIIRILVLIMIGNYLMFLGNYLLFFIDNSDAGPQLELCTFPETPFVKKIRIQTWP